MSTKILVPSTAEPISLAQAKDFVRVTDTANDATITRLIRSARRTAENVTGQAIAVQTYQSILETDRPLVGYVSGTRSGSREIEMPMSPVQSFLSVTDPTSGLPTPSIYYENHQRVWTVLSSNLFYYDLDTDPSMITVRYGAFMNAFTTREFTHRLKVSYIAGYPDFSLLSENILQAMYMLIGSYFDNRDDSAADSDALKMLYQERVSLL